MKYACLAAALATTWLALPAEAATFATPNDRSIVISGRIDPGDEARFLSSLSRLRRGGTIEVHLSSPGGSVLAAMKIADIVHRAGLTTQVPYRATCASACVLVFAAGVTRIADADSTIAVHSVGMRGQADVDQEMVENGGTLAATTLMARIMSSYGAPPSVVGKTIRPAALENAAPAISAVRRGTRLKRESWRPFTFATTISADACERATMARRCVLSLSRPYARSRRSAPGEVRSREGLRAFRTTAGEALILDLVPGAGDGNPSTLATLVRRPGAIRFMPLSYFWTCWR